MLSHWKRSSLRCLLIISCLAPSACSKPDNGTSTHSSTATPATVEQPYALQITELLNYQPAMQYRIELEDCEIKWLLRTTQEEAGVVQDYSTCSLPVDQQLPHIKKIVHEIAEFSLTSPPIRFLAMNYLKQLPEMAMRLGVAVAQSPRWNSDTGQLRDNHTPKAFNSFIQDIANEQLIYRELKQVFNDVGLDIEIMDATNTLIKPAGQLPYYEQLKVLGIQPQDQIPYDSLFVLAGKSKADEP